MALDGEGARRALPGNIDSVDALIALRDRFDGLRCAIRGASLGSEADRRGLLQLAEDVAESLEELCATAIPETGTRPPGPARRCQRT